MAQARRERAAITIHAASYLEKGQDYQSGLHSRDDFQWYHVVYGEVEQRYGRRRLLLEGGSGVLYPPGVMRGPRAAHAGRRPPGYFWVTFANHALHLDALYGRVLRVPQSLQGDIEALVDVLRAADLPQRDLLRRALVERLLLGLAALAHAGRETPRAPLNRAAEHRQVAAALAFIDRHLGEPITRDDIAAAAHCSPAHLARLFRAELDRSVGAELVRRRLARAKDLLLASERSIAQVAGEVGYASYSHFTQLFRREVGITPSAYRRAGGKSWR